MSPIEGELKLISYERAFKMLKNDMCVSAVDQAILELRINKGILKPVGKCHDQI